MEMSNGIYCESGHQSISTAWVGLAGSHLQQKAILDASVAIGNNTVQVAKGNLTHSIEYIFRPQPRRFSGKMACPIYGKK